MNSALRLLLQVNVKHQNCTVKDKFLVIKSWIWSFILTLQFIEHATLHSVRFRAGINHPAGHLRPLGLSLPASAVVRIS